MTRRNIIKNLIADQLAAANSRPPGLERAPERVLAGPVRTMSLTLDKIEEESRALQMALAQGATVVELDPLLVDASFASDRFVDSDLASFHHLKASISENGQEVPILVRPHPRDAGRYQAAYGHRRLKAVRELGLKIRAVVRSLNDEQLVVAQGVENSARQDLSYIEKAMFAKALESRGFARTTIMAALSTDKTELSKLLSAAGALPEHLIKSIGAAPKAGRRRWLRLAELVQDSKAFGRAKSAIAALESEAVDTDVRFLRVLRAAEGKDEGKRKSTGWRSKSWATPEGKTLGRFTRDGDVVTLRIDETTEPRFGEFLIAELDALLLVFRSSQK